MPSCVCMCVYVCAWVSACSLKFLFHERTIGFLNSVYVHLDVRHSHKNTNGSISHLNVNVVDELFC